MPQLPPPHEPKPAFLRLRVKDLQLLLSSPGFVLVMLVLAAAPGLVSVLMPQRAAPPPTPPSADVQGWTTDTQTLRFASVVLGKLPPPDPLQRRKDCRIKLGQVEIAGACWQRLDVAPPCPIEEGAYEHEDHRCYVRVLRAEQPPTSGEPQRANIAGP